MPRRRNDDDDEAEEIVNPRNLAFALRHARPRSSPPPGDWGEIDAALLEETRLPVPAFPLDLLTPFWRDWARDTARSTGAAADYVVLSLLAAVAGLAGAGARVRLGPRWHEPLVLWQALVGPPSSGKSPAIAPMRELLATLDAEQGEDKRACVVSETSLSAVADAVAANPRGVVLWRDDGADWLAGLADAARGHWLQAWSAQPLSLGARRIERFAASLLLAFAPERLGEMMASEELAGRFLFAWPVLAPRGPLVGCKPARDGDALAYLRRIARKAGTPADPLELIVDERGQKAFDAFLARLHAEQCEADGVEAAWLGKGSGTVARLAGILELLAWSELGPAGPPAHIGAERIDGAARLWSDYFRPHARALFHRMVPSARDRQVRKVVRWLRQHGPSDVSREEIRCDALHYSVNASDAEQLLYRLRDAGIVQRINYDSLSRGRPPNRWWVNPALITRGSLGNSDNSAESPMDRTP
ncbi:MAG: DUF3987 domain-containing protein [Rhodospirillales bacterium]|nr:DUF3987 domain-containing protein [Rhodospirillales bacterium]